jgi:hypothetical protein
VEGGGNASARAHEVERPDAGPRRRPDPGGAAGRGRPAVRGVQEGKHPAAVLFAAVFAGYVVLASLAVLPGIVCAIQRRWRIASSAVLVLLVESATYRGLVLLHHPLDVGAGALIGIGAVVVLLFACRAAGVAAPVRAAAQGGAPHLLRRPIPS